jgi:hypothetical protein
MIRHGVGCRIEETLYLKKVEMKSSSSRVVILLVATGGSSGF